MAQPITGQMRIWHIPQIGAEVPTFYVGVETLKEASKLLNVIWDYDNFQHENKIKPDFCNASGLQVYDGKEWEEWEGEIDGEYFEEIDAYINFLREAKNANSDNREYNEKFSNALTALMIMQDSLANARKDIEFLGKYSKIDVQKYTKTKLKEDFAEIEKAFKTQHKYMLELTKELQKTYKMY